MFRAGARGVVLSIERKHVAVIHIAKKQLCMNDDEYRVLLYASAGVSSASELRRLAQFRSVMKAFEKLGYKSPQERKCTSGQDEVAWGCTIKQRRKIEVLWRARARNTSDDALYKFIERVAQVNHPRWLSKQLASNVILALKKL